MYVCIHPLLIFDTFFERAHFRCEPQVLALLLLALGTDDMLVIMASHQETASAAAAVPQRLAATMAKAARGV